MSQTFRGLYPDIDPYTRGVLAVDDIHKIYWEECGNPRGVPVIFLHGGPGGGCSPHHRRFFDPEAYRIVLFDQRGCGRSRPLHEIRQNTTAHLISDIEALRHHREIDRWHVFGGSWGSTLALCYAQAHPEKCLSLILRGLFLMRQADVDWFIYGLRLFFPEAWESFASLVPESRRGDLIEAYYEMLTCEDEQVKRKAREAWNLYESSCSALLPSVGTSPEDIEARRVSTTPIIEAHYFRNNRLSPDNQILDNIDIIRSIPTYVVHGRYDMLCPVSGVHEMRALLPQAHYEIVPDAGHASTEPGITSALVSITDSLKGMAS